MAERAQNHKELQEKYMEVVYKSRKTNEKNLEIAAANLITVLNVSHYTFSGKNLSNIKIPGAELAGGEFVQTDFT